jgi:ferrous iron transport protein B
MAVIVAIFFGTYRVFKQVGKKQNGALEAQVA